MTTTKWSYIPFFPGEPTRDPKEPPLAPDYDHLVGLNPERFAVTVTIYDGKARIHLVVPEGAERLADVYADAYTGSSLGESTDTTPFFYAPTEEVHHVVFRTVTNHDMPVRVYMRGPKGHSGWWSDPLPSGQDVEYRDLSSHLFDGVSAFHRGAPRARIYLQVICERVGPMERKTTVRSLLGTPHAERIENRAKGMIWSAADGWHYPAQPTSAAFVESKKGVLARPLQSPTQTEFLDIFTRRKASHDFYRIEVRAAIVTRIGDRTSFDRALELLNTWRRQFRYLGIDLADYDLWTLETLKAPALKSAEAKKEWYAALDRAFEDCAFYPHGGNPADRRDLRHRELLIALPLPWERRHKCFAYLPAQTGSTQVGSRDPPLASFSPSDSVTRVTHSPSLPPTMTITSGPQSRMTSPTTQGVGPPSIRLGGNQKDQVPVVLPYTNLSVHVFGKPGSGKSTLTVNAVLGAFRVWHNSTVFIDPHGDGIKEVLAALTPREAQRTILIRPASMSRGGKVAVGMNPLRIENRESLTEDELIKIQDIIRGDIAQIVAARVGSKEIGDRIRRHMGNVVQALLNIPEWEMTLRDVDLVLRNEGKTPERSEAARMTRDQDARSYIEGDLVKTQSRDLQSSQNKSAFFSHPFFRAALCQRGDGVVTMERLLNENELVLIDLSDLTNEVKEYMGSAYLTMVWLAMRQKRELESGRILRLFVDEWPELASESFNEILHAGRKSGIRPWLVTQALGDIPDGKDGKLDMLSRVKGNVSTWITFNTDSDTAKFMDEYAHLERFGYDYSHYTNWPQFYAGLAYGNDYADMVIDPLPPRQPDTVRAEVRRIIEANTWRYAKVDNSKDSPLRIGKDAEMDVLEVFARSGTMTRDQAILLVPKFRSKVWTIIDNIERYHFLVKHKNPGKKDRYQITELGLQELKKYGRTVVVPAAGLGSKMPGGKDHGLTLERARAYVSELGYSVGPRIDPKVGEKSPDFTHELPDGTVVNDEVEDGSSHPDQIMKNYLKNPDRPKWFWAVDIESARRIVDTLGDRPNYQLYLDQGTSFSRYGPGVPKEEEPLSEEQDFVELAIVSLLDTGNIVKVGGRRAVAFKDITKALPRPLTYQKVRSVLERMVGDTLYAIRERRSELGGPLVILNDHPEDTEPQQQPKSSMDTAPQESDLDDSDVQMVIDTGIALSKVGKIVAYHKRGNRTALLYSEVYDTLPRPLSPERFKEVVTILLQQDEINELVPRSGESAMLVVEPPDTGTVDNGPALRVTSEELYRGLHPTTNTRDMEASVTVGSIPPPMPPAPPSSPTASGSWQDKEGTWEVLLRLAKDKWQKRQKSFLLEDGQRVALKFDTLYGMVKTALTRSGQGTNLSADHLVRILKEHGVEVESRAPPPHWTQTWHERFCLFPLSMLQETFAGSTVPSPGHTSTPTPPQPTGRDLMVQNLVAHANSLLAQGKVLPVDGKQAIRVSDICASYPPWNETQMGQHLKLLDLPTSRPWVQAEKRRVTVWFAWE